MTLQCHHGIVSIPRNAQVSLPLYFLIYGAGQANFNLRAIEILFGNELYSAVSVATTVHQNADKLEGGETPTKRHSHMFHHNRESSRGFTMSQLDFVRGGCTRIIELI